MASTNTNSSTSMLCYAVIIAFMASLVLSVDAIKCHQCNSHLDEDCIVLRPSTPRAPRDAQYLKACEGEHSAIAFCRKTVTTIEFTGEHRIVRGCGWHTGDLKEGNKTCIESDSEGYQETICACFEDGCNAAPRALADTTPLFAAFVGCAALLLTAFRRAG